MEECPPPSYAWRGPSGCGKRTHLLRYLQRHSEHYGIPFHIKQDTWYLNKQTASADPEDDDEGDTGKSIPYEESPLHLGFDVARMSMSDKVFLQSILSRWTGQQDLCLIRSAVKTRYLVLYHAHLLTDESVLQLQECLEQYEGFAILLTTELPLCNRLRDFCFEVPVPGEDHLLRKYNEEQRFAANNVWHTFFQKTLEAWSTATPDMAFVTELRNWIYTCLQRNLRWTDMLMYWMEAIYRTPWITPAKRARLLDLLWRAESGAGWVLVTSYRIPVMWEHVQLQLARELYRVRHEPSVPSLTPVI
jgi:hypothetical protein